MKNILSFTVLIISLLFNVLAFASEANSGSNKILIVLTSHTELGNTGKKTGFWLPELTHPYYEFTEAGLQVDVASIEGGMAPVDSKAFEEEDELHIPDQTGHPIRRYPDTHSDLIRTPVPA